MNLEDQNSLDKISDFYHEVKHPFLITNPKEAFQVYKDLSPLFIMIDDSSSPEFKEAYIKKAKEQKNNSHFGYLHSNNKATKIVDTFMNEFEIEGTRPDLPAFFYFQPDFDTLKYKKNMIQAPDSLDDIKKFIADCIAAEFQAITKFNSSEKYHFASYPVLHAHNWKAVLENSTKDAVVLLFQQPSSKNLSKDLQVYLSAMKEFEKDPELSIYMFNLSKNDIPVFIPDESQDSMMLYLKESDPSQSQVFQKTNMTKKEIIDLINRRSEFDKRNMDSMMGEGFEGMQDLDIEAIMKQFEEMNIGGMNPGDMDIGDIPRRSGKFKDDGIELRESISSMDINDYETEF
jgi:hypothetical protein